MLAQATDNCASALVYFRVSSENK